MYKFTNGLVFFDKESADKCIKAGFKLVEEKKQPKEVIDEEDTNIESISESDKQSEEQPRKSKRSSK